MQTVLLKFSGTIILFSLWMTVLAQKTDKVYLKNGDVVTGEIKYLKLAKLTFDMNGPGIINIKWEEIVQITSDKIFQVTLNNGVVQLTKLDTLFFQSQHIRMDDIVEIVQIKNKFWKRLEGVFDLGFTYAKSSDVVQFNFASTITYRQPRAEVNLKISNLRSKGSDDTITSKNQDASISFLKRLHNSYYMMTDLGWEENTELGLTNRFLIGGGGGKILINNNQQRLLTGAGLSYNEELLKEHTSYKANLDALAIIQYKRFRYSAPKISIDAQLIIYPSLSDWGRVRMNFDAYTNLEIFKDFLTGFTFYDNFDNRSSSTTGSNNDFGITFTIGYKFGK
jgi:hypothetical protein